MNHERVNIRPSYMSCGILELSRIGPDFKDVLFAIGSHLYHPSRGSPAALIVWSDLNVADTNSSYLTDQINLDWLGEVTVSDPVENPKTGNIIVVYTWHIDHVKFKAWYVKQRIERLKKI